MTEPGPILAPCPFCGGTDLHIRVSGHIGHGFVVYCRECHAEGPFKIEMAAACEWWNDRKESV